MVFELDLRIVFTVLDDRARTQFHEQAYGGGALRADVGPDYHIVLGWVAPTLKKVETGDEHRR